MAGRVLRVFYDARSTASDGIARVEVTAGRRDAVHFAASDLQQAQRIGRDIADGGADAVVDVAILLADDVLAARRQVDALPAGDAETLRYAGTVDGLTGLVADIFDAGVADGVTLRPLLPGGDVRGWAEAVLERLPERLPVARAA